jgi:replicative DNA helicase
MATKTLPKTILPPNCIEAEEALLGSLIIAPDMIPRVKAFMKPEAFYLAKNKIVYEAIIYLHNKRKPADTVTITKYLEESRLLAEVGGPGFITDLMLVCPTPYAAESYAEEVIADYIKRLLIDIGSEITKEAYQANGNLNEIIGTGRQKIQAAGGLMTNDKQTLDLKSSNQFYLDLLDRRAANKDRPKLKLPWPGFSRLMPELGYGDLVSVLAEPGVGKTVFLENCAEAWAQQGWKIAFFHLELNEQTMLDRRMNRLTGKGTQSPVPLRLLREPERLEQHHWNKIFEAANEAEKWPGNIHYIHSPGWTANRIISKAVDLHESHGVDIVIVDYFNKIRTEQMNGANYSQARGMDIETLKVAFEEYNWRGLMAAQFDKNARKPGYNKRGSDARDTAELEDKSNVIIVIDRQLDGENNKRITTGQFQVVKCNVGEEGSIPVLLKGDRYRFVELEVKQQRPEDYL